MLIKFPLSLWIAVIRGRLEAVSLSLFDSGQRTDSAGARQDAPSVVHIEERFCSTFRF